MRQDLRAMWTRISACIALALSAALGGWSIPARASSPSSVWILHATDVHPFVDVIPATPKPEDKARIEKQRSLNVAALKDLLARAPALIGVEGEPRLIVLSGDIDADPCWIAGVPLERATEIRGEVVAKFISCVVAASRTAQIQVLVDALADSPIHDIYIVPGNNDIARESAGVDGLKYFATFVADIQAGLAAKKSPVRLRNLSGCYAGGADTECVADIADTSYRLVALPSYSFKNTDAPALSANDKVQLEQLTKFSTLMTAAAAAHRKVIVVTHVPNIDDPYDVGRKEFSAVDKTREDTKVDKRSPTSTWNVTKPVLDAWLAAVTSDNVAAILAGHLHDSHKEVYRFPYTWAPVDPYSGDRDKLLLTPPLSVKSQDASPIQARGAALIELLPDRVRRELIWYEPGTHSFTADREIHPAKLRDGGRGRFLPDVVRHPLRSIRHAMLRIWHLGQADVNHLSVLLIAFLVAFLTVARIWQIPPPDNPFAGAATAALTTSTSASGGATTTVTAPVVFEASPFAGNFGKTVIAGLGGLVAETVLQSVSTTTATNHKEFYVIWFIVFFLTMLLISAVGQAVVEALRIQFAIRPAVTLGEGRAADWWVRLGRRVKYWIGRLWAWIRSLHLPLIVFLDTFFNRLQGRNQTLTSEFQKLIVDEHNKVLGVIEIIRRQLNELIEAELRKLRPPDLASPPAVDRDEASDVRVNISVMSADRAAVFYIATAPGSSVKKFTRRSVAWISVFTGRIRWYRKQYRLIDADGGGDVFSKVVLFDNTAEIIPNDEAQILLQSHYQPRDEDYEAFAVFPVPWPRRAFDAARVVGAIHVSFHRQGDFDRLWRIEPDPVLGERDPDDKTDTSANRYVYKYEDRLLNQWSNSPAVAAAIRDALELLAGAFQGFNENVYWYSRKE
jgi:hypothetical protein